jgi:TIGR03009 family protein
MSRHLAFRRPHHSRWIALALATGLLATGLPLLAQDQNLDPGITPNTRIPRRELDEGITPNARSGRVSFPAQDLDGGTASTGRTPRSSLQHPEMHTDPVDPEVDQLLFDWSEHTKRIKNLAGKHYRSIRDYAFGAETLAEGKFYIEMPDKGRLDISNYTAPSPKPGEERSYNAPNGTPTKLKAQYEKNHEKWVCDGKVVRVINDTRRTYEEVPIPADQQGVNMIDGPLPFLLGMPPDKAKARYRFKLLNKTKDGHAIWIEVKPRLAMDGAEWIRAYVLLNLTTYLPEKVSLFNPAGTTETVYIFQDIDTNTPGMLKKLFTGDPFNPPTWPNYRREVHAPPAAGPKNPGALGPRMPLFIGASSKQALRIADKLKALGFNVKFEPGPPAPDPSQTWHIASQDPPATADLRSGQLIVLRYYVTQTANKNDRQ